MKGKMKETESGLEISVDTGSEIPIYVQIKNKLRYLIQSGKIAPGSQMPTVRSLAIDFGVNANTISRVYRELGSEGMITARRGIGAFVPESLPKETHDIGDDIFTEIESLVELAERNGVTKDRIAAFLSKLALKTGKK